MNENYLWVFVGWGTIGKEVYIIADILENAIAFHAASMPESFEGKPSPFLTYDQQSAILTYVIKDRYDWSIHYRIWQYQLIPGIIPDASYRIGQEIYV